MQYDERKIKAKDTLLNIFRRQGKHKQENSRVPPGQHLTSGFPVLDLGVQPEMDMKTWKLEITGLVEKPGEYNLEQLKKLGIEKYTKDFSCVTSWTKLDVKWTGIPMKKILEFVKPKKDWKFLLQYGRDGYITNMPR